MLNCYVTINLYYGNLQKKVKKKNSSLYSLSIFSGVTSERCPSPRLCARDPTSKVAAVASRWQREGDLIGSRFEPLTYRTRSECLITCAICPVVIC